MERVIRKLCCALAIVAAGWVGTASAVPLMPGDVQVNGAEGVAGVGYTQSTLAAAAGPLTLLAGLSSPLNQLAGNEGLAGTFDSFVYQTNSGNLAFEYRYTAAPSNPDAENTRITINDPSNPFMSVSILDAGSDGTGSSTAGVNPPSWTDGDPNFILRQGVTEHIIYQLRAGGSGTSILGTNAITGLADFTAAMWLVTDADTFAISNAAFANGGAVSGAQTFAPAALVPVPGTMLLLISGTLLISRKRKTIDFTAG